MNTENQSKRRNGSDIINNFHLENQPSFIIQENIMKFLSSVFNILFIEIKRNEENKGKSERNQEGVPLETNDLD